MLSLKDYRDYQQDRGNIPAQSIHVHILMPRIARCAENDFSLLRSKIRELPQVHRASLGALSRHLLNLASHSDNNSMTMDTLVDMFHYDVLRGVALRYGGVDAKARCNYTWIVFSQLTPSKSLVLKDLIQNAHTLFDEAPPPVLPAPTPHVGETTSIYTYGSLFLSPELPQSAELRATASNHREYPELVNGIPMATQSSLALLPLGAGTNGRLTPPPITLLSPLLGLSPSKILTEGVGMPAQEQIIPKERAAMVETLPHNSPPDVVSLPVLTSVPERYLDRTRLPPYPEAAGMPLSPPESVLSSILGVPLSSATSLQTRMGFSP